MNTENIKDELFDIKYQIKNLRDKSDELTEELTTLHLQIENLIYDELPELSELQQLPSAEIQDSVDGDSDYSWSIGPLTSNSLLIKPIDYVKSPWPKYNEKAPY